MPRDVDFGPIFTDSYVGAKNAKNTRGFGMKSKGKTQKDTNTHNSIHNPNLLRLARKTKSNRITWKRP